MPRLNDVRFDTAGWQPAPGEAAVWRNDHGDDLTVLLEHGPPGFPPTGDPHRPVADSLRRNSDGRIELLAVERRPVAGLSALVGLIRAREGTGPTHGGIIMLPFAQFRYTFLVIAREHGVTGVRETMAAIMRNLEGQSPDGPLTPEQDRILDAALPFHPQARVRTYLDELLRSISLAPELASAVGWPPTRLPTANGIIEVRDGAILRRSGKRLVGRFPLAAVRAIHLETMWSRGELVIGTVGVAAAVLALVLLGGCWSYAVAGLSGFVALLGFATCRPPAVVIETPAGTFRWPIFQPKYVADGLLDYWKSLVPAPPVETPCPPSS